MLLTVIALISGAHRGIETMKRTRVIIVSDIHFCHEEYCNYSTEARMDHFISSIVAENKADPIDALILLGDYSLDFWEWSIKGCYIENGTSYTRAFYENYIKPLKKALPNAKFSMIAGNHEQYDEKTWSIITEGHSRNEALVLGDVLFLMLDTFAANLAPTEHSDGTYTGADLEYVYDMLEKHSGKKAILCSHYFDPSRDSAEFCALMQDPRIIAAVCGHNHRWDINKAQEYGEKPILYDGQFSYTGADGEGPMWGYREIVIEDNLLISRYITPEITKPYGRDEIVTYPRAYYERIEIKI